MGWGEQPVSSDAIRADLVHVLASPHFDASERNRHFLSYVVEEALAGRTDRTKACTIALIDNVLKPFVLSRGLSTPMLVILTGVIGGAPTHGLIGLFLGPMILTVFYELVVAWTRLEPGDAAAPGGS